MVPSSTRFSLSEALSTDFQVPRATDILLRLIEIRKLLPHWKMSGEYSVHISNSPRSATPSVKCCSRAKMARRHLGEEGEQRSWPYPSESQHAHIHSSSSPRWKELSCRILKVEHEPGLWRETPWTSCCSTVYAVGSQTCELSWWLSCEPVDTTCIWTLVCSRHSINNSYENFPNLSFR